MRTLWEVPAPSTHQAHREPGQFGRTFHVGTEGGSGLAGRESSAEPGGREHTLRDSDPETERAGSALPGREAPLTLSGCTQHAPPTALPGGFAAKTPKRAGPLRLRRWVPAQLPRGVWPLSVSWCVLCMCVCVMCTVHVCVCHVHRACACVCHVHRACACSGMAHWLEAELPDDWRATGLGGDVRAWAPPPLGSGQPAAAGRDLRVCPLLAGSLSGPLRTHACPAFARHTQSTGDGRADTSSPLTGGQRVHRHEEPFGRLRARGTGGGRSHLGPFPLTLPGQPRGDSEKHLRVLSVSIAWPPSARRSGPCPLSAQLTRRRQPILMTGMRPSVPDGHDTQDGPCRPPSRRPPAHPPVQDAHDEGPEAEQLSYLLDAALLRRHLCLGQHLLQNNVERG